MGGRQSRNDYSAVRCNVRLAGIANVYSKSNLLMNCADYQYTSDELFAMHLGNLQIYSVAVQ